MIDSYKAINEQVPRWIVLGDLSDISPVSIVQLIDQNLVFKISAIKL